MKRRIPQITFLLATAVFALVYQAVPLRSDVSAGSKTPAHLDRADNAAPQAEFIPKSYYRLTTRWQGDGKSLDIANDGKNNRPTLATTGNFSGQYWKLTPVEGGYYRLTTEWQGALKSLDVVNDGKNNNQLLLTRTGKFSGQFWKITPLGEGYYRLTTQWQGDGKSLDILNDGKNDQPILADTGNFSGQAWKITKVK